MSRLDRGGLIDRSRTLQFEVDGRSLQGFKGDTLASALMANDVRLVGRSFKYHRPRGILTAGPEEPNALFEVGTGADRLPNTRATVQEVFDGLKAGSQNRWPNLKRDMLAINDLLSPILAAGFYYKTFMWPAAFWERFYEPLIRRAAGLGRLSGKADPARYDKAFAHCDLLIIGSGAAGLSAALVAAETGARVILAEDDFRLGGRLLCENESIDDMPAAAWVDSISQRLTAHPNVTLMTRTTVTGVYDAGTFGALERVADHVAVPPAGCPRQIFWRIRARRAILAAGAIERPIAFPDNDRPGVMLAGAVRSYLNRFAVTPARRTLVFTNNDDGWRTAADLAAAGQEVAAIVDSRPDAAIPEGPWRRISAGQVIGTRGRHGLVAASIRHEGGTEELAVGCVAVSGGWNPNVHLTCHMNGRPVWREDIAAFVPAPAAVPGLTPCGAANGAVSVHAALREGAAAAADALRHLGKDATVPPLPSASDRPYRITPFWHVAHGSRRSWIDFQNDVTVKDIELAHRENMSSVEHMKRYTTLGMATDQGKTANVTAVAILADLSGQSVPQTGTTTFRPPYVPVQLGALGAGGQGKGFAPIRLTSTHNWAKSLNAPMIEAGLWYRPAYFPKPGETTWRQSCDREVQMVRETVGVTDVSTLGKIDVQGPDAATFLDRVYANTMSGLPVGKVRYGIMLREDGFVMDDGTCARLGEGHFLITTTTAAASEVMAHLEFCAQCIWPDLSVRMASVTDEWAQIAVCGPVSREVLADVVDANLSPQALPFMGVRSAMIAGVRGRVFRISYSGELGFELAVPARHGDALIRLLFQRAAALGGGPYGMEALNVLRIEKGFLTHAELHGRTTADDLGLGRMVSAGKDCIGKVMSQRPGLHGREREQLVGVVPVDPSARLTAGARFVNRGVPRNRVNNLGYLTSVCHSPTLGHMIGLGFLKDGRARIGDEVEVVDFVRDGSAICRVVPLPFVDPEGVRLHA